MAIIVLDSPDGLFRSNSILMIICTFLLCTNKEILSQSLSKSNMSPTYINQNIGIEPRIDIFFSLRGFATLTGLSVFPRHSIRSGRKLTISNSALSLKQSYQNCHQLLAVRHPGRKLLSTPLDGDLKSRLFWIGIIITFKL